MLGSAWEWLVGLVAVSPDGTSAASASDKGSKLAPAGWLERGWDDSDERAMVECILADEEEDAYLDKLLMDECGKGLGVADETCSGRGSERGFWASDSPVQREPEGHPPASEWQSQNLVAASDLQASSDIPPLPPLEYDKTPSRQRTKSVAKDLSSVVCQASRDEEASQAYWDSDSPQPAPSSSPHSIFDGFPSPDRLLPPQKAKDKGRRTLVLDLDETLVHSVFQPMASADFSLKVQLEQGPLDVYVFKRPGVDDFLQAMARHYEIVVFTASVKEYADPLLDILDPKGLVAYRLFRDACTSSRNGYAKDLALLGRSLSDIIIVDNSPHAYAFQPDNALPILSYYDDASDGELQKITPFLESLGGIPGDVRNLLSAALGANVKSLLQSRLSFLL